MTGFSRSVRLVHPDEYQRALRTRPRARSSHFFCHLVPSLDQLNATGYSRLGLIVPKRMAKQAVRRNATKRIIREAFRLNQHVLPEGDIVIRLKSPLPVVSLKQLKKLARAEVDKLFDALRREV